MKFNIKEWQETYCDETINYITEVKYTPDMVKNIKKYIELSDPDADLSDSEYAEMERIEADAKDRGYSKNIEDSWMSHYPRPNRSWDTDALLHRQWVAQGKRITKGGKMNKNQVRALKNRIKQDRDWDSYNLKGKKFGKNVKRTSH